MRSGEPRAARAWALVAIVLVLVAGIAVAATYTPLFAANDLRVEGSGDIPREEVLRAAGVDERTNVFHLDVRAAERRLEGDPRILDATVHTSLPDTLAIRIVPREAVAILEAADSLVGADGVMIGRAGGSTRLPALVASRGGELEADALATAAAVAAALGPRLRSVVDAVVVTADGSLRLRLAAGFSATLGDDSELAAKAASLEALLAWAETEDVSVRSADLTVPGSPTATLDRGGGTVPIP
jgi:cell division protein FtsQ